jgi:3-hydroxyacyl-CoA dehydrogenase
MTLTTIGIVGAGNMGCGIAEVAAVSGLPAVLVKATPGGL